MSAATDLSPAEFLSLWDDDLTGYAVLKQGDEEITFRVPCCLIDMDIRHGAIERTIDREVEFTVPVSVDGFTFYAEHQGAVLIKEVKAFLAMGDSIVFYPMAGPEARGLR